MCGCVATGDKNRLTTLDCVCQVTGAKFKNKKKTNSILSRVEPTSFVMRLLPAA